jgi:integrase
MKPRLFTETWLRSLLKKPPPEQRDDTRELGRKGFYLRWWPGGTLTFVLRYGRDGRSVLPLGNYPASSLEDAHKAHAAARELLSKGVDPGQERARDARAREVQERHAKAAGAITIRNVIAEWAWHYARRHRKRPREAVRLLRVYLKPWAGRPVGELVKRDAVLLIDRITARGSLVMANRIRDLAAQAFNFAIERDLIEVNPFAGIRRPGGNEQPKERTLTAEEIRTVWRSLASPDIQISSVVRLALKMVLVTAQRPGEIVGATWAEFDIDEPMWRIPAERSKNGKPHEVPLSDFATELLAELRSLQEDQPRPCIAPSWQSKLKPNEPLSERALSRALRNNIDEQSGKLFGVAPFTPHDLRRSAATHMTALGIARLHVAKLLNHTDRDITSIYDRHDYGVEKRAALQTWANHLRAIIAGKGSKVVPLAKELRA